MRLPRCLGMAFGVCTSALAAQRASPLHGAYLHVDDVADSGTYYIYRYRVVNAPDSRGGLAMFSVDVSAPRGTGFATLPATGGFDHGAGYPQVDLTRFKDHVQVGPISPPNWRAILGRGATLAWYGDHGGFEGDIGSIAPGDSLSGVALRSPYLLGIRRSWGVPTFKSCCTEPRPATASREAEHPQSSEFELESWTVGPSAHPGGLNLTIIRADLQQVCGALRWIADGAVCGPLQATLARAAAAAQRGDRSAATDALRGFVDALDAQHGPGKPVNDNAYWLLKVNAKYLLAHM